jgi:hypothetical protein
MKRMAEVLVSSYEAVRSRIKPGDVIAFSGNDLPSQVVKVATNSQFVHVAIVIWVDQRVDHNNAILIAESHVDTSLPSVGTGERRLGVQFQWLSDRIKTQPPPIWWVPLQEPLAEVALIDMLQWLEMAEDQKTPYDFMQAIGAGLISMKFGMRNHDDESALFCSELVTKALQVAGVLDPKLNASEQLPVDVVKFPCFEAPVLIKSAKVAIV